MTDDLLTVGRWVADGAALHPRRTAIRCRGAETSYAELDERSRRLAEELLATGYRRGDRVATLTGNGPDHVVALFACAKAGLVLVPLNRRLAPRELAYQLDDAGVALLLVGDGHADAADAALEAAETRPATAALGVAGVERRTPAPPRRPEDDGADGPPRDHDPLLLIYTSGTTGRPKGAVLTHANCFWTNLSFSRTAELAGDDTVLQVLPQFHVGGWNCQPLLAWWVGATVVIEPGFDAEAVLGVLPEVTTMMGVPANYLFLAEHERFAATDLTGLRYAVVGGAPMPEPLLRTWHARGVRLIQGYGLTEAAPNVLCVPAADAARKVGCAGKPYPYVTAELVDPATGATVRGPGVGELVVRGPGVFAGYWGDPEATAEALRGGVLHTGDVAERDAEGFYRIRDRLKDMYVSGGENVYPAEVETVLHEHPAVADAAVVGVADPRWGEVGTAVVVVRDAHVTEDELIAHCRAALAAYKAPKSVEVVDALPRSAAGKVLKTELRATYQRGEGNR